MQILRQWSITILVFLPTVVVAGELGSGVPWIRDWTRPSVLDRNNDDYVGDFAGNPNKFTIHRLGLTDSDGVEQFVPTLPSAGITEYAVTIGGGGINFDNVFELQLGFGAGDGFVSASSVAPQLRFDIPETVSPPIEDTMNPWGVPPDPYPLLAILDHQSDTLRFRGSSNTGSFSQISFSLDKMLKVPIDIPDLDLSVRDYYTPADLGAMPTDNDRPFTVRMHALYGSVDVDRDSLVGAGDVDLLTTAIIAGSEDAVYDLDLNGVVDRVDRDVWVRLLVHTIYGDTNLDREFTSEDLIQALSSGEYEDGVFFNSTWSEGDWNGDTEFDSQDLVTAFRDGGYHTGRRLDEVVPVPVPEPSTCVLITLAIVVLSRFARGLR